jgi:hypothetical protein
VRDPEEERHHLLYNAAVSSVDHTTYSQGIVRALSAVLALDTRTQRLKPIFKDRREAELDLLLEHSSLFINDKWLDFQITHAATPCWLSQLASAKDHDIQTFSCDHVVTDLYELVLQELINARIAVLLVSSDTSTCYVSRSAKIFVKCLAWLPRPLDNSPDIYKYAGQIQRARWYIKCMVSI